MIKIHQGAPRRGNGLRTGLLARCAAAALSPSIAVALAPAASAQVVQADIAAQSLGDALMQLSRQANVDISAPSGITRGKRTSGVKGAMDVETALRRLLAGSGLSARKIRDRSFLIEATAQGEAGAGSAAARSGSAEIASSSGEDDTGESSRESADIVVTAQKRSEKLLDVPVPVTSMAAANLTAANQVRIEDYYVRIPGLNINPTGFGGPQPVLRGVTTGGFANPTVGVVVDDVPYGSSTNIGGLGSIIPDLDPSTLARVEVLRGPQGTLYGASALGGLLKFVTTDPSTSALRGRFEGGMSGTRKGGDLGYSVRGSLNVPLAETFAVVVNGFSRSDPGFIDNVQTGGRDVNTMRVHGGRVAALWQASSAVSFKLSALFQHQESDGADEVDPTLGDLLQDKLIGSGGIRKDVQVYTATLNAALGGVDLVGVTGYGVNDAHFSSDYTPFFGGLAESSFGLGGAPLLQDNLTRKFTQELRLSGSFGATLDWLLGGFYMNERSRADQSVPATDPTTGDTSGEVYFGSTQNRVRELAIFGNLTINLSDMFDIQVGGRQSFIRQRQESLQGGPAAGGATIVTPPVRSKAEPFTYLITPRLKITPDMMIYTRFASGFRVGGPNPNVTLLGLPRSFGPDQTRNYELGFKGAFLDRRLSVDVSFYLIDWKDIQLYATSNGFSFYSNGGRARSRGIEASFEVRPNDGLTLSGWTSFGKAALSEDLPAAVIAAGLYGQDGDRLPQSPRFAGGVSADQSFALGAEARGHVGASYSYQGNRPGDFPSSAAAMRVFYPAYSRVDLRAGVDLGNWTVNLFANNLLDRRARLAQAIVSGNFLYLRPRTIGLNLAKSF